MTWSVGAIGIPTDEQGDVYPPVPAGYKNNTNPQDAAEDYVSVAVGESGEVHAAYRAGAAGWR